MKRARTDPLTAPMLRRKDPALVETVIHELVHANVYLRDHPQFNEGVARFIGQEAAVRFFGGAPEVRLAVTDSRTVAGALLVFRERVASLYAEQQGAEARATARSALESRAREAIAALPLETRDPVQLADAVRLNDACLALQGTYAADTPEHIRVLEALQGDLGAFVARLLECPRKRP